MTFQKYLNPLEIRDNCKNTQCNKPLYDLKRASFKEAQVLFCSKKCRDNFYKYEFDIRKLLTRFRNKYVISDRSLKGRRGKWRLL